MSFDHVSDNELITRVLNGEERLYEVIMRRYNQKLYRVGMSILDEPMDVEDAMQNTYVNAYRNLGKFEQRSSLGTWMIRIHINECMAQKKRNGRMRTETDEEVYDMQFEHGGYEGTPANALLIKELKEALEAALAELPEKYRLVFVMREIEHMSTEETGEALELSESNVKVRLNRAKHFLRESLEQYYEGDNVYPFHLIRCDRIVNNVFRMLELS
ncbi:RNA polymerase sigma factor [Chitinophagaceae bacterium MMS25-I14]